MYGYSKYRSFKKFTPGRTTGVFNNRSIYRVQKVGNTYRKSPVKASYSKDEKYTIRGFTSNNGIVDGVWLEEIKNDYKFFRLIGRFQEPAFALWRFRKLEPAEIQMEVIEYADVD